jgi:hypothetical protein
VASLLRRGLLAGLLAGLAAGSFYFLAGEPVIQQALRYEVVPAGAHSVEVFSRGTQRIGLLVGVTLFGLALGGLFTVLYALIGPRLAASGAWDRSLRLASACFAALWLVPFLKYPSNPPGVGSAATAPHRLHLYVAMLAVSVGAAAGAWQLARFLAKDGMRRETRQVVVGAAYLALIGGAWALLPDTAEPTALPAALLWQAREVSAAGTALLWLVLGVSFGWLGARAERREGQPTGGPRRVDAPAVAERPHVAGG